MRGVPGRCLRETAAKLRDRKAAARGGAGLREEPSRGRPRPRPGILPRLPLRCGISVRGIVLDGVARLLEASPAVCGAEWFLKPFLRRLTPKKAEVSLVSQRYRTETVPGPAEPSGGCAAGPGAAGQGPVPGFGAAAPRSASRSRAAAR